MANHKSAEKRHRQNLKRRARNRAERSAIRTSIKKSLQLAKNKEVEAAQAEFRVATKLLDKAVIHGVLHKNNAARRISRLQKTINASA